MLGMQCVGGDDRPGDLDTVHQRGEQGDIVDLGVHPGLGAVRWAAHSPPSASNASASRRCQVRRNVDYDGTGPLTPSLARVSSSASAAHSAITVNERVLASTAHTASTK
jgi:hypothetical protein